MLDRTTFRCLLAAHLGFDPQPWIESLARHKLVGLEMDHAQVAVVLLSLAAFRKPAHISPRAIDRIINAQFRSGVIMKTLSDGREVVENIDDQLMCKLMREKNYPTAPLGMLVLDLSHAEATVVAVSSDGVGIEFDLRFDVMPDAMVCLRFGDRNEERFRWSNVMETGPLLESLSDTLAGRGPRPNEVSSTIH